MDPGNKGIVDLDRTYEGPMTMNITTGSPSLTWEQIDLARKVTDSAVTRLETGMGVAYFSTWIYVPRNTPAKVSFRGYGEEGVTPQRSRVAVDAWINRYGLRSDGPQSCNATHPIDQQDVYLRKGWNHVLCRHIAVSGGIRNMMDIALEASVAGEVRNSREPPITTGRVFRFDGVALNQGPPEQ